MKRVTQNLLICIGLPLGLVVFTIILAVVINSFGSEIKEIKEDIESVYEDGEVDTIEGHGAIFSGGIMVLGVFAEIALIVVAFFVGGYAVLLIILAVIARVIFAPKGGRLLAYRILMGIEYVLQAFLVWLCVAFALDETLLFMFFYLRIGIGVAAALIYSVINTYSKRICE